jgi:hypothetical protein
MPEITISEETAALLHELWQGLHTEHPDTETRTREDLVDDAVKRVHRGFFGLPPGAKGGPEQPTGPFRKWASTRWAEVMLRQVGPKEFRLAQPFRYDDGQQQFDVPEDDVTDLASVPRFLTWLIPRYGRHTLAALVHDNLQDNVDVTSERADEIFRDSMGETGVPLSRRWLMWAAVALRTQWNLGGLRAARVALWAAVFGVSALVLWPTVGLALVFSFGREAVALTALAVGAAIAVPVALSWLWGRLWRLGALGGMALSLFTVPVVLVLFALGVYLSAEWTIEHLVVSRTKRNPVLARNL